MAAKSSLYRLHVDQERQLLFKQFQIQTQTKLIKHQGFLTSNKSPPNLKSSEFFNYIMIIKYLKTIQLF